MVLSGNIAVSHCAMLNLFVDTVDNPSCGVLIAIAAIFHTK